MIYVTDTQRSRQRYAALTINTVERFGRAMTDNRTHSTVDTVQDALCFAECITEQNTGKSPLGIAPPPFVDIRENGACSLPAINGKAKRRFGDKRVARNG